jgi:hypothetical protein
MTTFSQSSSKPPILFIQFLRAVNCFTYFRLLIRLTFATTIIPSGANRKYLHSLSRSGNHHGRQADENA